MKAENTLVGEKGATLSGGQKARVALARALYADSDVYLLDDPLSAVDPSVAAALMQKCVLEHLASKTVILATHRLGLLSGVDKVLLILDNHQEFFGGHSDFLKA